MDDDDGPTPLSLPHTLPYPITITRIYVSPGDQLNRGSHLFEYKFTSATSRKALDRQAKGLPAEDEDKDAKEWDMVGTWDSEVEGEMISWEGWVKDGVLVERKLAGKPAVHVKRPCDHSVQFGGLCAKCGIPLDADDYLSRPEDSSQAGASSKKGYTMSHDAMGVTVSTNEAKKLENQSRNALLSARKLTLIVDLDQTIIHTTVDPTVGEWMTEIEQDSMKEGNSDPLSESKSAEEPSTTPPSSPKLKEKNPNAEALQDVAKFQLDDDLPPGYSRERAKKNLPKEYDRWYYTKPRPGLPHFLKTMSEIYEMHVYTMGTRTYANAVCKAIDPDASIFGGRILTRDESGSFNAKDLKRLFPTDQSMVVIIDDRSDVWSDVPNLVKVVPYDFFIGQGDINAPKSNKHSPPASPSSPVSSVGSSSSAEDNNKIAKSQLLDELSEKRPLAKLQQELEEEPTGNRESPNGDVNTKPITEKSVNGDATSTESEGKTTTPPGSPAKTRRPLLDNNDKELERLSKILTRVHRSFYAAYDARSNKSANARLPLECDVPTIIPEIKASVLDGCRIVFSGVIPTHISPDTSDVWRQAETFGATPMASVSPNITHCVIGLEGTEKASKAHKIGAQVVWVDWFHRCIALWERLDESGWLARGAISNGQDSKPSSKTNTPKTTALQLEAGDHEQAFASDTQDIVTNGEDGIEQDFGDGWDDDEFMASIRAEAGMDDDASDAGTEEGTDRPSSPPRSILASPRSRGGSVESMGSVPGTPRKRVRYADEEDRPLSTYKDPPPGSARSPPKKRPRALLMPAQEGDVPAENTFQWKGKSSILGEQQHDEEGEDSNVQQEEEGTSGIYEPSEVGTEDDEFAQMLQAEMEDA